MRYQLSVELSNLVIITVYWWNFHGVGIHIFVWLEYSQNTWPVTPHLALQKNRGTCLLLLVLMVTINCSLLCAASCLQRKEKVYHCAMKTALWHLVTNTTLSFNQCIAWDQESAIFQPLRTMMDNVPYLNKSRNRLDKHHLLTIHISHNLPYTCSINNQPIYYLVILLKGVY